MSKSRKGWIASWLCCSMLLISGMAVACSTTNSENTGNSDSESETETSIPEGVVDFDEAWLEK